MNTHHTPSEWKAEEDGTITAVVTVGKYRVAIAKMEPYDPYVGYGLIECQANQKLMATSPDLLAALKDSQFALESVFHLTGNKEMLPYIQQNAAVIAQAEGRVA